MVTEKLLERPSIKRRGRRPVDPASHRSERLVLRVHPDLLDALNMSADEVGLSRSLFVERCLLAYLSSDPRIRLDHMGRRVVTGDKAVDQPPGSLASFGRRWETFTTMRQQVLGDYVEPPPPGPHTLTDRGHDHRGKPVKQPERPKRRK